MLSRSYAIRHASEVVMCKSHDQISCSRTGGWDQGWIIFSDPDGDRRCLDTDRDARCDSDGGYLVRTYDGIVRSGVSVTASGNPSRRVVFTPEGFADGYMGTFSVCDERGETAARGLKLIMSGRIVAAHPGNQLLRCP
jgi:type IV fimbrial biogenesis protein FimT